MNTIFFYTGPQNINFEIKLTNLVDAYGGKLVQEFFFENGEHSCEINFENLGQFENFKRDIIGLSKIFMIDINFGGIQTLD